MDRQRKLNLLIDAACLGVILGGAALLVFFVLPRVLPFVLGVAVAVAIHPLARWLVHKFRMGARSAAVLSTGAVYVFTAGVVWVVLALLYRQSSELIVQLPEFYQNQVQPLARRAGELTNSLLDRVVPGASQQFTQLAQQFQPAAGDYVRELSSRALGWLGEVIGGLPMFSVAVLFTVMTSIIVSWDYNRIAAFLTQQLPPRMRPALQDSKKFLLASALRMLKAYFILMFITFGELALGLWLLGVDYWLPLAALTAAVDILPVLGSGAVLVTWGVVELLGGNTFLGVGLLVLWGIISLVRNLLEPKVVGDQIGLHPLVTLTAMYFGLHTGGFWGLLIAPVMVLLLIHLHKGGYLKLYRTS